MSLQDEEEENFQPPEDRGGRKTRGSEEGSMTFLEHLEDLRFTLFRCLGVFAVAVLLVAIFIPWMTELLQWPHRRAQGGGQELLTGLISMSPMGVFSVMLQVVFLGALSLSLPFMLYFVALFIAPALTEREKRILGPGLAAAFGLFLLGALFCFTILLPLTLRVSFIFNQMLGLELIWSAVEYYSFVVWMTIIVGLLFEFPLVIIVLEYTGVVSLASLRRQRRMAAVIILAVSAVVTPSDPISLFIMALPLYGLYEASLWMAAKLAIKRKAEEES